MLRISLKLSVFVIALILLLLLGYWLISGPSIRISEAMNGLPNNNDPINVKIKLENLSDIPTDYDYKYAIQAFRFPQNRSFWLESEMTSVNFNANKSGEAIDLVLEKKNEKGTLKFFVLVAVACKLKDKICEENKPIYSFSSDMIFGNISEGSIEIKFQKFQEDISRCNSGIYNEGTYKLKRAVNKKTFLVGYRPILNKFNPSYPAKGVVFRPLFFMELPIGVGEGGFRIDRNRITPTTYSGPVEYRLLDCSEYNNKIENCFSKNSQSMASRLNSKLMRMNSNSMFGCGLNKVEINEL